MSFLKPGLGVFFIFASIVSDTMPGARQVWVTLMNERGISLRGRIRNEAELRLSTPESYSPLSPYLLCSSASQPLFWGLSFLLLSDFNKEADLDKVAHCLLYINKCCMNKGCHGQGNSGNTWSKMINGVFFVVVFWFFLL